MYSVLPIQIGFLESLVSMVRRALRPYSRPMCLLSGLVEWAHGWWNPWRAQVLVR